MAISFNTGAKNSANTATSVTLAIPGTVAAGNVMIMALEVFCETGTTPTISFSGAGGGWTLVPMTTGTNPEVATAGSSIWSYGYAYYRVATAGDIGATLTITESGSAAGTTWLAVAMAAYAGADTSSPIDVAAGNNAQGTSSGTGPTVTTVTANDWALQLACVGINATPLGGPATSRENVVSSANVGAAVDDGNAGVAAGTSIGGGSWTQGGNTSNWWSLFTIGLAPAGAAAAPYGAARQAVQAKVPAGASRSGVAGSELAAGTGNIPGPVHGAGFGGGTGASGAPVRNPTAGPVFRQAVQAIRAGLPQQQFDPRGRAYGVSAGGPVRNPTRGPAFRQAVQPVRARIPQNAQNTSERVGSNTGAAAAKPSAGPAFRQAVQPVQARLPLLPVLRGRTASNAGAPVRNPSHGPGFRQATSPERIRPALPPKGRSASNPGGPVQNPAPPVTGPPFYPLRWPARIRPSLPPRGRVTSGPGVKAVNPTSGPVITPAGQPAGGPVIVLRTGVAMATVIPSAAAPQTGPPVRQATQPVRARLPLLPFLRGRATGSRGAPVRNPSAGPAFEQAVTPAQARIPQTFSKGRTASNAGAPVRNPTAGPRFRQATSPARIRPSLPPRGRVASNPGAPVFTPVTGPAFRQATQPARARIPQNAPRGRVYGNPGAPARNPHQGAVFPAAHGPAQARIPLPPRGRTGSNPGIPVPPPAAGPRFTPRRDPARIRITLPPCGRVSANPGGPVRNPHSGPVFTPKPWPARAVIPQPAAGGRARSSAVAPGIAAAPVFRLGVPYFDWATGTAKAGWR